MKFNSVYIFALLIAISTLISTYILPWYLIGLLLFCIGFLWIGKPWSAFTLGFFIPFLTWVILAYLYNSTYENSISRLVGEILGKVSPLWVYALTGLSIGLVSGFSALSGNLLTRILVVKEKQA